MDIIVNLLAEWGYVIVFFGVMLENAGLPVPGETVLLAAGFFASQGRISLGWVIVTALLGAVLGDNAGYWIGRRLGRTLLVKYGRFVFLTEERLVSMEVFFEKHGDKMVAVARFITGFRVFTALFAGASVMPWRRFFVFNVVGAVAWSVAISLLGYFFGKSWTVLEQWIRGAGVVLAALVIIALVVRAIMIRSRRKNDASN